MRRDNKNFIESTKEDLQNKGFNLHMKITKRHDQIEAELKRAQAKMQENTTDVENMMEMLATEYKEFLRNRKRWKSDFKDAENKVLLSVERVDNITSKCIGAAEVNSKAIKMILDAQMIDQLI